MTKYFVVVVTETGSEEELTEAMLPFHEPTVTGYDVYLEDVDILGKLLSSAVDREQALHNLLNDPDVVYDEREVDLSGQHKEGHVLVKNGEVVKVIIRTNPNSEWDWWMIAPNEDDFPLNKQGQRVESCRIEDLAEVNTVYAFLSKDGWFDYDMFKNEDKSSQWETWDKTFHELLSKCDPNHYVTMLYCHC